MSTRGWLSSGRRVLGGEILRMVNFTVNLIILWLWSCISVLVWYLTSRVMTGSITTKALRIVAHKQRCLAVIIASTSFRVLAASGRYLP